jgi:hypothetical protein
MPSDADTRNRDIQGRGGAQKVLEFSRAGTLLLTAVLVIEVLAVAGFQTPLLRFDRFAIFDSGGELAIQDLIRRGYRPSIDFGHGAIRGLPPGRPAGNIAHRSGRP